MNNRRLRCAYQNLLSISCKARKPAVVIILISALSWFALGLIPPPLLINRTNASCAVTDRNDKLLRLSLTGDEKYRLWMPLESMPLSLQ
ncbi:MAG: hypothetical protein ACU83U_15075, partial [Gammaproteobacteria bacterium]